MHAYIICGGTTETRRQKVHDILGSKHIDIRETHIIESGKESIGIDLIRDASHVLTLRPVVSPNNALVVYDAGLLTQQAQNALLKILEEPPAHAYILLETSDTAPLLPTVLSRCQSIAVLTGISHDNDTTRVAQMRRLQSLSIGASIQAAGRENKDKNEILSYCTEVELGIHTLFHDPQIASSEYMPCVRLFTAMVEMRRSIAVNVNAKLAFDWFFLRANSIKTEDTAG